MAFFKKMLKKINNRWYPQSVLVGKPITTERIAYRLAAASTLTPSDVIAVLVGLGPVMADYMAQGHSVKLAGIGTFFLTATTAKGGAPTKEEVTAKMITGVRMRFIPETRYRNDGGGRIAVRPPPSFR